MDDDDSPYEFRYDGSVKFRCEDPPKNMNLEIGGLADWRFDDAVSAKAGAIFGLYRSTPAHRFSEEYKAPHEDTNERILRELEGISDGIQKIVGILQEARSQKDSKTCSQQAVGSVHPEADNALAGEGAAGDDGFR